MKETKLTNEIEHFFFVTVKVSELFCIYSAALLCLYIIQLCICLDANTTLYIHHHSNQVLSFYIFILQLNAPFCVVHWRMRNDITVRQKEIFNNYQGLLKILCALISAFFV